MLSGTTSGHELRVDVLRERLLSALFCHWLAPLWMVAIFLSHLFLLGSADAQAITRGYATDDSGLRPGMTVSLAQGENGGLPKVQRAGPDDQDKIIGVATTISDSLVTVGSSGAQVYIENEGNASAYATSLNGAIKKGDLLSISPLKGILMKADGAALKVVAIAQSDFDDAKATQYTITGGAGTALVEEIDVNLDAKGGTHQAGNSSNTVLTKIGQSLTGRQVSDLRVIVALIVFFIVMISEGTILYGAISSGVRSIGRNPLAGQIIRKEMLRVAAVAIVVLAIGLAAMYAMLWV